MLRSTLALLSSLQIGVRLKESFERSLRQAVVIGVAVVILLAALCFGLLAAYNALISLYQFSAVEAACIIAAALTLLGLLVLMSFIVALRAQYVRHDPLLRGISFGSMMGIIALMIHSAVDFNLQIPANALAFMLVLAFAWISLYHDNARHSRETPDEEENDSA